MAEATKKRMVGLVVLTDIPDMGRVAVLQRRGEFNHEKMGPESFPGLYQVTVHGKVEEGESSEVALYREFVEKLGDDRAAFRLVVPLLMIQGRLVTGKSPLKVLLRVETEEKVAVTYGAMLTANFLKEVRLGPSSGGLRLLREDEVNFIQEVDPSSNGYNKKVGIVDRRVVAMFPDEKEAVRKAFRVFGSH